LASPGYSCLKASMSEDDIKRVPGDTDIGAFCSSPSN
jgi:hypothetical protein